MAIPCIKNRNGGWDCGPSQPAVAEPANHSPSLESHTYPRAREHTHTYTPASSLLGLPGACSPTVQEQLADAPSAPRNFPSSVAPEHRVSRGHFEFPSQILFPKSASNLTHFSFKTRKHQQTLCRETDGNNYRRGENRARSLYQGHGNILFPRQWLSSSHSCVNVGMGLPLGPSPHQGTGQHWRGRQGYRAP